MRIVQYLNFFDLKQGGVVRAVIDLCTVLVDRGHEVRLLTFDDTDIPAAWRTPSPSMRVDKLSRSRLPFPRLDAAGAAVVRDQFKQADAVHLHVPWDPINLHLSAIARHMRKPYVLSIHGMLDEWTIAKKSLKKRAYLALGGRTMLERAVAVHCTAQAEQDQSQRWYPRGRSAVIPLLFDLAPFDPLPGPEAARAKFPEVRTAKPIVLFVGRLHAIKRIELLIAAAGELKKLGQPFALVIAGPGDADYEAQLRRQVSELGLDGDVVFTGFVSGKEKVSLYQTAKVFVLPSHHENFGFVSVEAMACRVPVVTTRAVNIWPELGRSGGATICDPTPGSMAQAIAAITRDPVRQSAMGEQARAWVFDELNPDRVAKAYEALYQPR